MQEPKKFVPRTDIELEAMRVPPLDPMVAEKDREEEMRAICGWLIDHVEELQLTSDTIWFRLKDGRYATAMAGNWIMVRANDVVTFSDEEFFENYEEVKEFDIDYNRVEVRTTDRERPGLI